MIIAIDLDGVVFDTEEYYRTYAHLYDIYLVKNGLKDREDMTVFGRHNWDQKTADDFYAEFTEKVLNDAPIMPGAKFVINELKKLGHKLVCITLRGYYRECEITVTEKRLKENDIHFDKIIYSQAHKLNACLEEKIDILIDDSHKNVKLMAENGIKCLHFRGAGLKRVNHKNIKEVQNWAQILEEINNY